MSDCRVLDSHERSGWRSRGTSTGNGKIDLWSFGVNRWSLLRLLPVPLFIPCSMRWSIMRLRPLISPWTSSLRDIRYASSHFRLLKNEEVRIYPFRTLSMPTVWLTTRNWTLVSSWSLISNLQSPFSPMVHHLLPLPLRSHVRRCRTRYFN